MKVYTPQNIDTFKEEYHLNEQQSEPLDEARDMMKRKPMKQPVTATQTRELGQREADRAEYEAYYHRWEHNTFIYSDIDVIYDDSNFKAIVNMGKRAVPFIYETIKNKPNPIVCALSPIYGFSIAEKNGYDANQYLGIGKLCELWIEKLEEDGAVC